MVLTQIRLFVWHCGCENKSVIEGYEQNIPFCVRAMSLQVNKESSSQITIIIKRTRHDKKFLYWRFKFYLIEKKTIYPGR